MRIAHLTPGTGGFYCGTCLRDNALVKELRALGHDALMVPMYLPPTLDEEAAPGAPLFYGGVNVYLQQKLAPFRRTPRWVDSLFDSPKALKLAASRAGSTQAADLGELTLSTLRGELGRQVKELDRLVAWLSSEARPDVVCLSNALLIGLARRIRERTGAAVVCTLQGEDTFFDDLPEADSRAAWDLLSERAAEVDGLIAVSQFYADLMTGRARLPRERVHVVHNGILLDGYGPAGDPPAPPVLGFLGRMCPAKGLHALVDAFALLRKRGRVGDLKLKIAGTQTAADRKYVAGLLERLPGLEADVEVLPNLDRDAKLAFLRGLTVLSVPATYAESFGLYLIEAMAAGVPVVQPRQGAIPEILEATGGGVLCEPNNVESLALALEGLLLDPVAARAMGERGRTSVQDHFTARRMAEQTLQVFDLAVARRRQ
ncbi:MAG TPA: glycosyltransferase family 4 protein [Armatimonadota bacterium]|jgi:glycosyltransferase involved in cell wall biosynthesis